MDLTKILKIGDRIYSPMLGFVTVVDTNSLITVDKHGVRYNFHSNGKYLPSGEVMLKITKETDFVDYQFKRGDYVVSKLGDVFIASGKNRVFVGAAVAIGGSGGILREVENWATVKRPATDHECYLFDQELKKLGYKWNGTELVPLEEWVNIYKDSNGIITCSSTSYSSKEAAHKNRLRVDYYATVRIK